MRFLALSAMLAASCAAQRLEVDLSTPVVIQQRLDAGVTKQKLRESAIEDLFTAVGCAPELQKVGRSGDNVICRLPGETDSTITVGGHYDFVEYGQGIIDDWSGASLLPSLYQALKGRPHRHTFVFIAFTGEEAGLLGSQYFAGHVPKERRPSLLAFVNLECLGVGTARVWATRANKELLALLGETAAALKISVSGMSVDRVGDDDSHPFLSINVPVITIHSLTSATFPMLHSSEDNRQAIDFDKYYDAYRLAAFYLADLDLKLQP